MGKQHGPLNQQDPEVPAPLCIVLGNPLRLRVATIVLVARHGVLLLAATASMRSKLLVSFLWCLALFLMTGPQRCGSVRCIGRTFTTAAALMQHHQHCQHYQEQFRQCRQFLRSSKSHESGQERSAKHLKMVPSPGSDSSPIVTESVSLFQVRH